MHQTIEEAESAEEDFSIPCCMRRRAISKTLVPIDEMDEIAMDDDDEAKKISP